jgi:hypothetical protein
MVRVLLFGVFKSFFCATNLDYFLQTLVEVRRFGFFCTIFVEYKAAFAK